MHKIIVGLIAVLLMVGCGRQDQTSTRKDPASSASTPPVLPDQGKDGPEGKVGAGKVEVPSLNSVEKIAGWQAIALKGKRLELVDSSIIQIFDFVEDEHVIATLGIKGEAVSGPILMWKISNDVLSITSEARSSPTILLRDPVVEGNPASVFGQTLRVRDSSGSVVRYKLSSISTN